MEPILFVLMIIMVAIIGMIIFNSKININVQTFATVITIITFGSIVLLMFIYNSHPECDAIINHNNQTLQLLQDKCYQYIDF